MTSIQSGKKPMLCRKMYDADRSKIGEPVQLDMAQLPELVIEALPPAENGKPETGGRVVKILQPGTLDEATAQEAMQRGTFVAITIQDVPVRGADLVDIVKHYVAASKLTAVHVRNCGLAVPGGQHIARTMADLSCLYSEGNRIRDGGMNTVAAALANNASLRVLGLVNEGITLKGAMALAEALQINTALVKLDLRGNALTREGVKELAFALCKNSGSSSLKYLYLDDEYGGMAKGVFKGLLLAYKLEFSLAFMGDYHAS